jgi:uncharacterized protein (TIGR02453 family)
MNYIKAETYQFFNDLRYNNNKEWFHSQQTRYKEARANIKAFIQELHDRMNEVDVIERHKISRINRDIRFSKNKTIYKDYFWGSFIRFGKQRRGGYMFSVEQDNRSFCGGGFYKPNPTDLLRIRNEFNLGEQRVFEILGTADFKKKFGKIRGEEVKTAPRGFSKDSPNIELIRKKQFTFKRSFTDEEVLRKDFMDQVFESFCSLRPFFDYMSEVLTTDLNGESIL